MRDELTVTIPALALVVLASQSEATAQVFAERHFSPDEIFSIAPESADPEAFEEARVSIGRRLADGLLAAAVIARPDTELTSALARLAHHYDVAPVAMLLGDGLSPARFPIGPRGYASAETLASAALEAVRVVRQPLACDLRGECGPFDIIGDIHGCYAELVELLETLGYARDAESGMRHPDGRRAIFVGDLVDRGPGVVQAAQLVMRMVETGQAFCAPGNHDIKLMRAIEGRHVYIAHGLQESLDQIAALPTKAEREAFTSAFASFIRRIPPYLVLDGGSLVVAHAGLPERYHDRISERIRVLVFYGETTGWEDEHGLPVRIDWAAEYLGAAAVVYGHTPHRETGWRNNTINVDTGCVHGGRLTAVRWPERDVVSVAAHREYAHRAGGLR